ncbi:disks large-associated protein 5 isoform X2 [Phycodurus eques]|uniref:disks large-associated protein 5 isoform X2 n=1 Tax=Phycodurus eques TaxID=693459 RepID=UPI002ACEFAB0|nr:disks large-associated protein 5 isoform X2 [Phycodurus eques]
MDSRFSYLRHRDNSVTMLRIKMSRRLSQNQKENRERVVDARRPLDNLQEHEMLCQDDSTLTKTSPMKAITNVEENSAKDKAIEEKVKQLARWKERKALEKEKQKQARERKGVFKTGLYRPKDTVFMIHPVPASSTNANETKINAAPSQSGRVTRSMKQQQQQQQPQSQPLKTHNPNTAAKKGPSGTQRATRGASTRSANRLFTAASTVKKQPADKSPDQRITRSRAIVFPLPQPSASGKNSTADNNLDFHQAAPEASISQPWLKERDNVEPVEESRCLKEENIAGDTGLAEKPSSFAPEGFVFQAPAGLKAFNSAPLSPRSADLFLAPRSASPCSTRSCVHFPAAEILSDERQTEPSESPCRSAPPLTAASPIPSSPLESKHDVPYFRSEMANETDRLTSLCGQWETKVDDESVPEEMRGCIRTTVGQARLLMRERFKQFSSLVDDCELCRGEKITTCTDLQGFWDMVYFQVDDVHRKFGDLKEAEERGWVEVHNPPPRQRKAVKKPAAGPAKPAVTKAAANSRLAAAKAAMRAQKRAAEAEKAAKDAGDAMEHEHSSSSQVAKRQSDVVVFDGGFFRVESPAKTPASGWVRRSSRLGAAAAPQASPCANDATPRRVIRRSLALGQTSGTPVQSNCTLTPLGRATNHTSRCSPRPSRRETDPSLCFSPLVDATPGGTQLKEPARAKFEHLTLQKEVLHTVTTAPPPLTSQSPQAQTAEASLFLFTPNPKDKIRPSACPSDLMYFTPPP